ncbi:pseudouridine synthase [Pseudooceanicola sp. MF1-13]|uniref:pseudouridine synthase n=1 Tax=Pseudooceanicola sp. MF1-13 TaxID=3379095 RepID=UPI0038928374
MSQKPTNPASSSSKTPAGDRIAKVLSRAGIASRREAEKMIGEGRVSVNGKVIESPALNVTAKDKIAVDGRPLDGPEPARLWLYHKPTGLVTTHKDEQGRPTIYDDLLEDMPRVMSVGRLDLNSEGLLLLTNDGGLKRQLELPSTGWLRRYRVRVKGNPTDTDLAPLRDGIVVDRETFQPMQVTLDRQQGANAWLTVGLREGKNREIRRAMENIGLSVNRLIRVSYGPFQLGPLKPGEVEEVRRRVLRDQLGLEAEDDADAPKRPRAVRGDRPDRRPKGPGKPGPKTSTKTAAKPGQKSGGKPAGKPGAKPTKAKDAPWETDARPRLTRRRPKKN